MQLLYNYYINLVLIVHWFDFQTTSSKALTSRCRLREFTFLMYLWYLRCCDFPFWSLMGCLHLLVSRQLFILFIFISMYRFPESGSLTFSGWFSMITDCNLLTQINTSSTVKFPPPAYIHQESHCNLFRYIWATLPSNTSNFHLFCAALNFGLNFDFYHLFENTRKVCSWINVRPCRTLILRIKIETSFELACLCPKLTRTVLKKLKKKWIWGFSFCSWCDLRMQEKSNAI